MRATPRPQLVDRSRSGRVLAKVLVVITVFSAVLFTLYYFLTQVRMSKQCESNLASIYRALELYELDRGTLPSLAFYPDDPKVDQDSLLIALGNFGVTDDLCLCPASPAIVQDQGISYLWNVALNGEKMPRGPEPTWILVDIDALSMDVPTPHLGYYNVLYSDGVVRRIRDPIRQLNGL